MKTKHRFQGAFLSALIKTFDKLFRKYPGALFFLIILSTSGFIDFLHTVYVGQRRAPILPPLEAEKNRPGATPGQEIFVVPVLEEKSASVPFWKSRAFVFWTSVVFSCLFTFILRAYQIGRSFEIFIDEATYLQISRSVASSLQVQLYGQPFFLHPPAFFFIEAAFLKIFQPTGDLIQQIYTIRLLNAAIASLSAVLIFMICYRALGWYAGMLAVFLFGLNPFIIQIDSLNLLEATAIGWVVAGYAVIISAMFEEQGPWSPFGIPERWKKHLTRAFSKKPHEPTPLSRSRAASIPFWRLVLAGIFFGLALLTKETTAFLSLMPLAICFLLGWSLPRRASAAIGAIACSVYSIYPIIVYFSGNWAPFAHQKFRGILRFAGILKFTGFNRSSGPSLAGTVISRLDQFATTYLIIALGVIAAYILLSNRGAISQLVGVWCTCAYAMMAYLIFWGTLEEQYFLYLVVPSLIACAIAAGLLLERFVSNGGYRKASIFLILLFFLFTGWDGYQWVHVHTTPDNGYEQVMTYLRGNVPGGARVASTSEVGQYALGGYLTGPYGLWHTVGELTHYHPEYLLVTPDTIKWNYGEKGGDLLEWVDQHGIEIFHFTGREGDRILLYKLDLGNGK